MPAPRRTPAPTKAPEKTIPDSIPPIDDGSMTASEVTGQDPVGGLTDPSTAIPAEPTTIVSPDAPTAPAPTPDPVPPAKETITSPDIHSPVPPARVAPQRTAMPEPIAPEPEGMVSVSVVQKMIADALRGQGQPLVAKKVTEHIAHAWRYKGQWVLGFVNQNKDPILKDIVHAVNKYNNEKREYEPWVEVMLENGTTDFVPLLYYLRTRVSVNCPIKKREKIDKSYSFGPVEVKKEDREGRLIGTGRFIEQEVTMVREVFTLLTPDGKHLVLPDYILS